MKRSHAIARFEKSLLGRIKKTHNNNKLCMNVLEIHKSAIIKIIENCKQHIDMHR